jgi:hypothetical protein
MYRLLLARPAGFSTECPELGNWLLEFGGRVKCGKYPNIEGLQNYGSYNARIAMCRNKTVEDARKHGVTHILWVDPDMAVDCYVKRDRNDNPVGRARPFFDEAWNFILDAKRPTPAVLGVPYCGCYPFRPVQVFAFNERGALARIPHKESYNLRGWTQVGAVGTGLMLTPMTVFDRMDYPYFHDQYQDVTESSLRQSQDVFFCLKCKQAGIPIYVNWDCPAGHRQSSVVDMAGWEQAPPRNEPIALGADPTIPVLSVQGPGDTCWGK